MSAIAGLQAALVARLKADAGVGALIDDRIFDGFAPADTPMPYVVVVSPTETERGSALGMRGLGETVSASVFAKNEQGVVESSAEALAVAAAVDSAARATALVLPGHTSATLRLEMMAPLVEQDLTRHVPIRWRAQVWEA